MALDSVDTVLDEKAPVLQSSSVAALTFVESSEAVRWQSPRQALLN